MADAVDIDVTREMQAPLTGLWEVLSDLSRLPEWLAFASAVEDVSPGEASAGSTYTVKPPGRFEPTTHWEVKEVETLRRQVHASEMPLLTGVTSTIELLDGTGDQRVRAHVHWRGEPRNLAGRLMRPIFQKRIQQSWERSLEQLDALAR